MANNVRLIIAIFAIFFIVHSFANAGGKVKSGLQPGESLTNVFHPYNVTGPFAGDRHCLVCENGLNPVAMVFAREVNKPLVDLMRKLDLVTKQNRKQEMGSFVVFLNDKDGLDKQLQSVAKKHGLKTIILSIDDPEGPEDFKISKVADVTVVLYREHKVIANHAFRMGELSGKSVTAILADVPKILVKK